MYDIESENIIPFSMFRLSYLELSEFSGSSKGMRYVVRKEMVNDKKILMVYTYKDKFNLKNTRDEDITKKVFDFSNDGIDEIKKYLTEVRDKYIS